MSVPKMFSVEEDLLGLVVFLSRGGDGNSCYYTGTGTWWLKQVSEQIQPDEIGDYIVELALDNLSAPMRNKLCRFSVGKENLTLEEERSLRDQGFCTENLLLFRDSYVIHACA